MDFRFRPEEEAFRAEVADFIRREFTINPALIGESHLADTPEKRAFLMKLAETGWLTLAYPEEYGGTPGSGMLQFLLNEELAYQSAPVTGSAVGMIGMTLLHHGSEQLKQEFIPPILRGELEFALGYTEPEAGSDLASLQFRAVRDGDDYLLNGQKRFTSSAHFAPYIWLAARTDPNSPKHRGISIFIVDTNSAGITVRPLHTMGGQRTNEVFFEQVRVPAYRRVGEENRGWAYLAEALDYERFTLYPFGPVLRHFENLVRWAKEATIGERRLADDPQVRRRLGRLALEVEVAWMLVLRAAAVAQKGGVPNVESTMNKLWATQLIQRMANIAVDMGGLYGQLRGGSKHAVMHGSFEQLHRARYIATIAGGSTEVQKNVIARRYLGLPG